MIHVSRSQMDQVEYLIRQSIQGNHVLFEPETVKYVLSLAIPVSDEDAYSVEPHLERIIAEPTLEKKRAYVQALDRKTFETLIRTYFKIVEESIVGTTEVKH